MPVYTGQVVSLYLDWIILAAGEGGSDWGKEGEGRQGKGGI